MAVLGVSKGGDLAMSMAAFIPEITVVINVNGGITNAVNPLRVNEKLTIPAREVQREKVQVYIVPFLSPLST